MSQEGNVKALKTGNRSRRSGIVLATLGKRYGRIYASLKDLRRALEFRVLPDGDGPDGRTADLLIEARVNEVLRWEMVARVSQRLISDNPAMPADQVASALGTIGYATRQRNAMLARLLDSSKTNAGADPWAALEADELRQAMDGQPPGPPTMPEPTV